MFPTYAGFPKISRNPMSLKRYVLHHFLLFLPLSKPQPLRLHLAYRFTEQKSGSIASRAIFIALPIVGALQLWL